MYFNGHVVLLRHINSEGNVCSLAWHWETALFCQVPQDVRDSDDEEQDLKPRGGRDD